MRLYLWRLYYTKIEGCNNILFVRFTIRADWVLPRSHYSSILIFFLTVHLCVPSLPWCASMWIQFALHSIWSVSTNLLLFNQFIVLLVVHHSSLFAARRGRRQRYGRLLGDSLLDSGLLLETFMTLSPYCSWFRSLFCRTWGPVMWR